MGGTRADHISGVTVLLLILTVLTVLMGAFWVVVAVRRRMPSSRLSQFGLYTSAVVPAVLVASIALSSRPLTWAADLLLILAAACAVLGLWHQRKASKHLIGG
jgi:hypothetical protein